jgi:hypothetical protein
MYKEMMAYLLKTQLHMRKCPMCGHFIDLGQQVPRECALVSLTRPFRDRYSWDLYTRSGLCQDCQDIKYGRVD